MSKTEELSRLAESTSCVLELVIYAEGYWIDSNSIEIKLMCKNWEKRWHYQTASYVCHPKAYQYEQRRRNVAVLSVLCRIKTLLNSCWQMWHWQFLCSTIMATRWHVRFVFDVSHIKCTNYRANAKQLWCFRPLKGIHSQINYLTIDDWSYIEDDALWRHAAFLLQTDQLLTHWNNS